VPTLPLKISLRDSDFVCKLWLESEMGSGRVQPEPDRRLARDFVTSDRSRARSVSTRPDVELGPSEKSATPDRERAGGSSTPSGSVKYPAEIDRVLIGISTRDM